MTEISSLCVFCGSRAGNDLALGMTARAPGVRVTRFRFSVQPDRVENRINPAHQMIGADNIIKPEGVEKPILKTLHPTHHLGEGSVRMA